MKKLTLFLAVIMLWGFMAKAQVNLQDGLVAYYPFNGNANDESGNGNNAIMNSAVLTTDRFSVTNHAYLFNGSNSKIVVPHSSSWNFGTGDLSISSWVNSDSINTGRIVASGYEVYNQVWALGFGVNGSWNPGIRLNFYNYPGWYQNYNSNEIFYTTGQWAHVCVVISNKVLTFYYNGVAIGTETVFTTSNSNSPLTIGAREIWAANNYSEFFDGKIDDIRIYNRALNEQEVQALYSEKKYATISTSNLTKNWLETFDLPISTTELKSDSNYISYQFDLAYDSTMLQYLNKSLTGTIAAGGSVIVNSATPGQLSVSYMTSTPLSGAGDILKLQFKAIEIGSAPITITNFLYNNSTPDVNNGTITIQDTTPPTAAITYSDADGYVRYGSELIITATFSEPMADSPVPQIALSGANTLATTDMTKISSTVYTYVHTVAKGNGAVNVSLQTGTDEHGNVVTPAPVSGGSFNVIPLRYGDVDDNTFVRAYDAALTLQYSVGLNPLPTVDPLPWEPWRIATANVDGTGNVTAYDASLILQYSVGLIKKFPAEDKSLKDAVANDVDIQVINNEIVFTSKGELFGLNIDAKNENQILDTPVVLDNNFITAFNIHDIVYNIGLSTAYSPANGAVFMKIPFNSSGKVTLNMNINSEEKIITVDLDHITGITEFSNANVSVYPNPATHSITIKMPADLQETVVIELADISGKTLYTQENTYKQSDIQLDLSKYPAGNYLLNVKTLKGEVLGVYKIQKME